MTAGMAAHEEYYNCLKPLRMRVSVMSCTTSRFGCVSVVTYL